MANEDLYLRSDVDKGETSPDKDLRLRSQSDKETVGPTPNAYNKILYTSEPPTPNAWNQVKREAGTGWRKLQYV